MSAIATNMLLLTILLALPERPGFRNRAIYTLGCVLLLLMGAAHEGANALLECTK